MSQYDFGTIDPATKTGVGLADLLNAWRTALHSSHRGAARPSYAVAGMVWVKTIDATREEIMFYDGVQDVMVLAINPTTHAVLEFAGVAALIQAAVDSLVDASPGALDTLNELAAAMGDDPNFATTMTNALAGKLGVSAQAADADKLDGQHGAFYQDASNMNAGVLPDARLAKSSEADLRASAAGKVVSPDVLWASVSRKDITDAATVTLDFNDGLNWNWDTIGGNRTLANPLNVRAGQQGFIRVKQDATGGRTISFGGKFHGPNGVAPAIDTAPESVTILFYTVIGINHIAISAMKKGGS
jgi:hypothetical protein